VTLSLPANAQVQAWPATTATPTLMLRCQEGGVEAYFALGVRLQPELDGPRILMRFDQGEPRSVGMGSSTDGLSVFFEDAAGAIANMLDSQRLLIRFVPFNSNPQQTSFTVSGLKEAIKPLAAACAWDVFGEIERAKAEMAVEAEKERAKIQQH
jgi:type VI secretion system protein VasI